MIAQLIEFSLRHPKLIKITIGLFCFAISIELVRIFFWTRPLSSTLTSVFINRKDAKVLDLRSQDSFLKGHIPDSQHSPYVRLAQIIQDLPREKPIILITEYGEPSFKALRLLRRGGFKKLYHLEGGIETWQNAHLPLVFQND